MAGGQPEPARAGPFVCEYCAEEWPSARALSGHIKAHKGKAPAEEPFVIPSAPPPGFGPAPRMMPPPAGSFFAGVPRRPLLVPRLLQLGGQPQAPPLHDPVVSAGPGGTIRMVLLQPNYAFWASYRMGMEPPVELDFMGLGLRPRPPSPSPSFASWLNA